MRLFSNDPDVWPPGPDDIQPEIALLPAGVGMVGVSREHLCELAADRANLTRALNSSAEALAFRDPTLQCGVLYFRLDDAGDLEHHRDLVMDALVEHHARPLANGEAPWKFRAPFGYCVLFDDGSNGRAGEEALEEVVTAWERREQEGVAAEGDAPG